MLQPQKHTKIFGSIEIKVYLCIENYNIHKINRIMATPIRVIPTLHGEEARKFIERAEWVEAHPGQTKMDPAFIKKMKAFLRENNMA